MRAGIRSILAALLSSASIIQASASSLNHAPGDPRTVVVGITPDTAMILPGATIQLTASVTGTGNQAVRWSVNGGGTITQAGLFTAGNAEALVEVKAKSLADPTAFATINISVTQSVLGVIIGVSSHVQTNTPISFDCENDDEEYGHCATVLGSDQAPPVTLACETEHLIEVPSVNVMGIDTSIALGGALTGTCPPGTLGGNYYLAASMDSRIFLNLTFSKAGTLKLEVNPQFPSTVLGGRSYTLAGPGGGILPTLNGDDTTTVAISSAGSLFLTLDMSAADAQTFNDRMLTVTFTPTLPPPPPNPVIFVHGVSGSRLVDGPPGGDELWLGLGSDRRRLNLFANGIPPASGNIMAVDVLREITILGQSISPVYGPLLDYLISAGGYHEYHLNSNPQNCDTSQINSDPALNPNLFEFVYDWRQPLGVTAQKLKIFAQCVEQFHPDSKINILTHSMGSLVARRYILDNASDHNVDRMITIGAPWLGAPKLMYALESGEFIRVGPIAIAAGPDIKYIMPSLPAAHQLLPSSAYQALGASPIFVEDGNDYDGNGLDHENYDYTHVIDFLDTFYPGTMPGTTADQFHSHSTSSGAQDDWRTDASGVDYFHFYGVQPANRTIEKTVAKTEVTCGGLGNCFSYTVLEPKYTAGDGTVPAISASRRTALGDLNAPGAQLFEMTGSIDLVEHTGLTQNPDVQSMVVALLAGNPLSSPGLTGATRGSGDSSLPSYYISIIGATSVVLSDTHGNNTAPILGDLMGVVPGVETFHMGDNAEKIVLPVSTDEDYDIIFNCTGEPMAIRISKGVDSVTSTNVITYQDLVLPPGVSAQLKVTTQGVENLRYDADGDGTFETLILPAVVVTGTDALDITAPILSFDEVLQGALTQITITAADDASGVHDVKYSTDGTNFQPYTGPLTFDPAETSVLYAFATDNVGNRSGRILHEINATPINITGLARNLTGEPISGVVLHLTGTQIATTQTDVAGHYAFSDIATGGNYALTATKAGFTFAPQSQAINNPPHDLTINFTAQPATNPLLSNLTLSSGVLSPAFGPDTTDYNASVTNTTTSITVTPTAQDAAATVTVNGMSVQSGNPSGPINLFVGDNSVITAVTAQNGVTTRIYTVVVTRAASSNANLSNLSLSAGSISPPFDPNTTSYALSVPSSTSSTHVTPTVADATAVVRVNGMIVPSGNQSGLINLNVGSNTINTVVTAQDGTTTKTYTITVTRAASTNANLSNLVLSAGAISPVFDPNTLGYVLSVPDSITSTTVTPTAADAGATITVNGAAVASGGTSDSIPLQFGNNNITTAVTAQDGTTGVTYTVAVTRLTHMGPVVTNINDSGAGSLRQALADAQDGDTITFAIPNLAPGNPTTAQTITLTSGQLTILNSITIDGPGADLLDVHRSSTAPMFRIFGIYGGHIVTIQGLTISNGNHATTFDGAGGGGIYNNHSTLTVSNCVFAGNSGRTFGGGIFNNGATSGGATLTVSHCSFIGNNSNQYGGGIYNGGSSGNATLTIDASTLTNNHANRGAAIGSIGDAGTVIALISNCTISGNSGTLGAAIWNNSAPMTIINSTVSNNVAEFAGGAIYNEAAASNTASLTINNSTLSGNSVSDESGTGGGCIYNAGGYGGIATVTINNTTLTGNSAVLAGGINNERGEIKYSGAATIDLSSTILNGGVLGENIRNTNGGVVTSHGYNLSSDSGVNNSNGGTGDLDAIGDQIDTDPMLGPLQDNGGPTLSHAPFPSSPAIDAGDPNFSPPPFYDQRGPNFARVSDSRIDIGSLETQSVPTPTATPAPIAILGSLTYCSSPLPGPLPEVTLSLTGTSNGSTLSDAFGNYLFSALTAGGSYTVTPGKSHLPPGLGTQGINTTDALAVQRHFLGIAGSALTGCALAAGDVNADSLVTTTDALAVQQFFLFSPNPLPLANRAGQWRFTPTGRTYMEVNSNQIGQDYDASVLGDVNGDVVISERPSHPPTTPTMVAVTEVTLPNLDPSRRDFVIPVMTSKIAEADKLVAFQGDILFDSSIVTFQSTPVTRAGLTANGHWALAANVLGEGPMKTLRISCFALDAQSVLTGEGALFELRVTMLGRRHVARTRLAWAPSPNGFIFIDEMLQSRVPASTPPGSIGPSDKAR